MDYNSVTKQRFKELRPGPGGRLTANWQLTDTALLDTIKLALPPMHAIPIIFVPGIMGSNLADLTGAPVWLLDSIKSIPVNLAWNWSPRNAGERQKILHPKRTHVYRGGSVPDTNDVLGLKRNDFLARGWGEVSESSYQQFLVWLDTKMNASRDPMAWTDFFPATEQRNDDPIAHLKRTLHSGMRMAMAGLPEFSETGKAVEPIQSDELLKRAKSSYPVYAFGYNWLDENQSAALKLGARIDEIINENNRRPVKCTQVILVTHSMGGLVARACNQLPGMTRKIVGIVHGVMPANGAAVAYRRCKIGMRDEDLVAGLVIGSDGKEVTAVFAQSPGALQLSPAKNYGSNWLKISDQYGQIISSLPKVDPYEEIYLQRNRWWSLIREEWLSPTNGTPIAWNEFKSNIISARNFHRVIAGKYHHNTFVFYGGGEKMNSFDNIEWVAMKGSLAITPGAPLLDDIINLGHNAIRTDGSNHLFVGGKFVLSTSLRGDASTAYLKESSYWEIHCSDRSSAGDGTVPRISGRAPRLDGGANVRQQFELAGVEHEPAFRDYPIARSVTYYAVTKLAALADRS